MFKICMFGKLNKRYRENIYYNQSLIDTLDLWWKNWISGSKKWSCGGKTVSLAGKSGSLTAQKTGSLAEKEPLS